LADPAIDHLLCCAEGHGRLREIVMIERPPLDQRRHFGANLRIRSRSGVGRSGAPTPAAVR
jgi:hypothetical protein